MRPYGQFCGLARAAEILGQRWALLVLRDLLVGPRRYSDLAAGLPGIPSNVLAARLKELEQDGLITRTAYPEVPPRVEYALSTKGETLRPVMQLLSAWSSEHLLTTV